MRPAQVRDALELGREAFESAAWRDAFTHLSAADAEAPLEPADLEHLATATYLIGIDNDAHTAWSRRSGGLGRPRSLQSLALVRRGLVGGSALVVLEILEVRPGRDVDAVVLG